MVQQITVGFDRSDESYAAVRWAAAEAELRRCPLRIVACFHMPVISDIASELHPTKLYVAPVAEEDEELKHVRATVGRAHPHLHVTIDLVPGTPWVALCDERHPSQMIVVGASAHRSAAAFWLGSTPRAVIRHASCPVVVVRGESVEVRRIVAGVDGSAHARAALDWAIDEANRHRVGLKLVHAWEYPYAPIGAPASVPRDLMQVDAACVIHTEVDYARQRCGADVEHELLEGSASVLLASAVSDGDLLVLGSRGIGAVRAGILGSTVNAVLDEACVPVAVIRHAR
jgi:nucleotide-binding universal stress UspA family protein